jgi:acyl-[acyl-carrier-protein]-phospholipid O-acyltransferase/long-chain-fatty-acid--[acyl-carrier-protein] ligase
MVAVNSEIAKKWWVKPALRFVEAFHLEPSHPMAIKSIIARVKQGKKCVIFPEGRLTVTGGLMKVYEGPGLICDKAGAKLIPIRIDGAMHTVFSRMRHKVKLKWFPKITITILPECNFKPDNELGSRQKRQQVGMLLYQLMTQMMFEASDFDKKTVLQALFDAKKTHGKHKKICEDILLREQSYQQLLNRSLILGIQLKKMCAKNQIAAIYLPSSNASFITFLALISQSRKALMLDTAKKSSALLPGLKRSEAKVIISSKAFIAQTKLSAEITAFEQEGYKIYFLEDLNPSIWHKLRGYSASYLGLGCNIYGCVDDSALLFISDANSQIRLHALSHKNIISNCYQIMAKLDFTKQDILFNPLSLASCNSFIMGCMLPLLAGIKVFFYPNQKHIRIISEFVYDTNSSILLGNETLLKGLSEVAHPYDFYSLRHVFVLGDEASQKTKRAWSDLFGLRLFQTYDKGCTLIAMNSPMQYKRNSLGYLLPAVKVDGDGCLLNFKGPNLCSDKGVVVDNVNLSNTGCLMT